MMTLSTFIAKLLLIWKKKSALVPFLCFLLENPKAFTCFTETKDTFPAYSLSLLEGCVLLEHWILHLSIKTRSGIIYNGCRNRRSSLNCLINSWEMALSDLRWVREPDIFSCPLSWHTTPSDFVHSMSPENTHQIQCHFSSSSNRQSSWHKELKTEESI